MKKIILLCIVTLFTAGCSRRSKLADAYGNFEANEVIVSSESTGKLIAMALNEGDLLNAGQYVATVDTAILVLQKKELLAHLVSMNAQIRQVEDQISVIDQQLLNLEKDLSRTEVLVAGNAAPQKQLDDLNGAQKVLKKQRRAALAQKESAVSEKNAVAANLELLNEQIFRSRIINPINGRVLETYSEQFEMTATGKPLYKIANLEEMQLKVYVSGGQLGQIKIGQTCQVRVDNGKNYITFPGKILWISNEAEFTPKFIQTKEERIDLVYAVKVTVKNDGTIKIGMPGEVIFEQDT
jgi:HlyD family secretion protein